MYTPQLQNFLIKMESLFQNKKQFWSILNKTIQKKTEGFPQYNWSDDVFIPAHLWRELLERDITPLIYDQTGLNISNEQTRTKLLASMMTICAWRFTQGVYTVHERLHQRFFQAEPGGICSQRHVLQMKEWSVYIQCSGAMLGKISVDGFFVHKTSLSPAGNNIADAIILTFNTSESAESATFRPMPYAVLNVSQSGTPAERILNFDLEAPVQTAAELNQALGPYLSLFNFVFDKNTTIESDIVGTQENHHLRVNHHYNFNNFNIANFKYSAPSNSRAWNAGLNHIVEERGLNRLYGENSVAPAHWILKNEALFLSKACCFSK